MDAGCTEKEKQYKESCKKGEGGIVTSVVIMRWMAACHGWLVNGIDARLLSLSAACGGGVSTQSCHVPAYCMLVPRHMDC